MGRKNILKHTLFQDQPGSADFNSFTNPMNVDYLDNLSLTINTNFELFSGILEIWVSNDKAEQNETRLPESWFRLDIGGDIDFSIIQSFIVNINQSPFSYLAVKFISVDPATTGTVTIKATCKMIGG